MFSWKLMCLFSSILVIKAQVCPTLWSAVKVAQSCLTLCDPMDYIVRGILQARILEGVAIPFSRGSSQPRDWTQVSHIASALFTNWAIRETYHKYFIKTDWKKGQICNCRLCNLLNICTNSIQDSVLNYMNKISLVALLRESQQFKGHR